MTFNLRIIDIKKELKDAFKSFDRDQNNEITSVEL